ncbi:hypothetical protein NUSPORA_02042 [Nucleospora cyclopteri]
MTKIQNQEEHFKFIQGNKIKNLNDERNFKKHNDSDSCLDYKSASYISETPRSNNSAISDAIKLTKECLQLTLKQIKLLNESIFDCQKFKDIAFHLSSLVTSQYNLKLYSNQKNTQGIIMKNLQSESIDNPLKNYLIDENNIQSFLENSNLTSSFLDLLFDDNILPENLESNMQNNLSTNTNVQDINTEESDLICNSVQTMYESSCNFKGIDQNKKTTSSSHTSKNVSLDIQTENYLFHSDMLENQPSTSNTNLTSKMNKTYSDNFKGKNATCEKDMDIIQSDSEIFNDKTIQTNSYIMIQNPNLNSCSDSLRSQKNGRDLCHKRKRLKKNKLGALTSGEIESKDIQSSEYENSDIFETLELNPGETFDQEIFNNNKFFKNHKSARTINVLNIGLNFIYPLWGTKEYYKNEIQKFLTEFSFSPGWQHFHLTDIASIKTKITNPEFSELSKKYGLQKYTSLIFYAIQVNTFSKFNRTIPFTLCYHIFCYHLCSKWGLGKGKNVKIKKSILNYKFITNKNFYKLYKPIKYWKKNAQTLYEEACHRSTNELGITQSSLEVIHLYNALLLIPKKNARTVAFVFFVYYSSNPIELDVNLKFINKKLHTKIIERRKKLNIILKRYHIIMNCVRVSFKKRSKLFKKLE